MKSYFLLLFFIGSIGCSHQLSQTMRKDVDETITFNRLLETPEDFIGKRVMYGGAIVETRVLPEGTEIEVVQKKIDFSGYPEAGDESGGRFIFFKKGFLEPEIYSKGRGVTGVGKLTGTRMGKVGERPYEFPVIELDEIKLHEDIERNPYFYPPYWDPWYRPHSYAPYWPFYR